MYLGFPPSDKFNDKESTYIENLHPYGNFKRIFMMNEIKAQTALLLADVTVFLLGLQKRIFIYFGLCFLGPCRHGHVIT